MGKSFSVQTLIPAFCFKKEMVKLYKADEVGTFSVPAGRAEIKNVNFSAFSPSQIELKIWLCQELENTLKNEKLEKPLNIWIMAGYYNVTGFLLFSRKRIPITKIRNFDTDEEAIEVSKSLCSLWQVRGNCESSVMDCNFLKYDEEIPDVVINTTCEHLKVWDWFENIPKGVIVVLQANNIIHQNHPNCFRSLADFKEALEKKKGFSKILFEGVKSFDELFNFQQYMLIGVK